MIPLNYTKEQIEARYKRTNLDIQLTDDWLTMHNRIGELEGAQTADNERLIKAAEMAGITFMGCDTPEHLADKVVELKAELTRLNNAIEGAMKHIEKRRDKAGFSTAERVALSDALVTIRRHLGKEQRDEPITT